MKINLNKKRIEKINKIIDFIEGESKEAQNQANLSRVALLKYELLPILEEIKNDYKII